jgi:trehalose 6-phosphate phosphatase
VTTPALPMTPAMARRLAGSPLLVLLDVDGTLAPLAPRPDLAVVPDSARRVVSALTESPNVHVAIISGRAANDARRIVGVDRAWIIGNHGMEVASPNGGSVVVRDDVAAYAERIAVAVAHCRALADANPGVIVEDKHWSLSVHYRLAERRTVPMVSSGVDAIARDLGLRVMPGKELLEVRPPLDVDKGTASLELAGSLGALGGAGSILCAGDDLSDEDAFHALRRASPDCVTVSVGADSPNTVAEFSVPDTEATRTLLEAILELRR